MNGLEIRPLTSKDFPALARIYNEIYTDRPTFSAEKLQETEEKFPRHLFREYAVAEIAGEVVASSLITQDQFFSHPGWYFFNIWVSPKHRRQGIGARLYDHLNGGFSALHPQRLQVSASEKWPESIRFLVQRGFAESHRQFESRFELAQFRPESFAALEAKLNSAGVTLHKLTELNDPHHRQRIYDLQMELERTIPGAENWPVMSFGDFWAKVEKDMPSGEFFAVARKGGDYIGLHYGSRAPGSEWFMVRVTAVRPEYRKLGVATALKARGMAYAKDHGFPGAFTWNDSRNQPILALNEKFGFQRQPAAIMFQREF